MLVQMSPWPALILFLPTFLLEGSLLSPLSLSLHSLPMHARLCAKIRLVDCPSKTVRAEHHLPRTPQPMAQSTEQVRLSAKAWQRPGSAALVPCLLLWPWTPIDFAQPFSAILFKPKGTKRLWPLSQGLPVMLRQVAS